MSNFLKGFFVFLVFSAAVFGFLGYFFFVGKMDFSMPIEAPSVETSQINNLIKSVNFFEISPEFLFSAKILNEFEAEYTPDLKAINVYNPNAFGNNNTEKSQIYITYFKANRFLTLSTVKITQREAINIKGQEAVLYEITKKQEVSDFAGQPSWRNLKHKALDIRFSDDSPTYFYSFAYSPNFPEKTFNNFINSLIFKK